MTGAELALLLKGGQMLANIGAGHFASKDAEKYQRQARQEAQEVRERNKRRAEKANLVNAFATAGGLGAFSRPEQEEVDGFHCAAPMVCTSALQTNWTVCGCSGRD